MEEQIQLGLKICHQCRNELFTLFPMLDGAFASLIPAPGKHQFESDGQRFYFPPRRLLEIYSREPGRLRRGYLHVLLHLLYGHPFTGKDQDPKLWDLACDMAVEQILEKENCPRLLVPASPVKARCLELLGDRVLSAREICGRIPELPFSPEEMAGAFAFDDHSLWDSPAPGSEELWQRVRSYGLGQGRGRGHRGRIAGEDQDRIRDLNRGAGDYRAYLQRFTRAREEMELDMDSFDYIYYHLGLERYGNLPLVEPLETREGHKLSQLVIAIDTSGSCDRETVRGFLEQTYGILSSRENFFRKMEVWLIQCDCLIQSVAVIHSREEWMNYSRSILVEGRGGTDFTPVFRFIDEQRSEGRLRDLGALLYFTDGDGCYPREKPAYETAFVFLKPTERMEQVPPWAACLLAQEEDDR